MGVWAVPRMVIDGEPRWDGTVPEQEFVRRRLAAKPTAGEAGREPEPGDTAEARKRERGKAERAPAPRCRQQPTDGGPDGDEDPHHASVHRGFIGQGASGLEVLQPQVEGA